MTLKRLHSSPPSVPGPPSPTPALSPALTSGTTSDQKLCTSPDAGQPASPHPAPKRLKTSHSTVATADSSALPPPLRRPDRLSALSDELLVRILHLLPVEYVLVCQAVSRRLRRLAGDAQVWKALYWARWVRPRVRMLPRLGGAESRKDDRVLSSGFLSRRSKWLDEGRLLHVGSDGDAAGHMDYRDWNATARTSCGARATGTGTGTETGTEMGTETGTGNGDERHGRMKEAKSTDWKARYKLRHNWSIGAAEVREIGLGLGMDPTRDEVEDEMGEDDNRGGKTLMVRLVDGGVITVDARQGLRAWDLKKRECVAQCSLNGRDDNAPANERLPTCLSIDNSSEGRWSTDIVIGFRDGGFEIWRLGRGVGGEGAIFRRQYGGPISENEKPKSDRGVQLNAVAYAHPYLLTITANHVLSLYVFDAKKSSRKDVEILEKQTKVQDAIEDSEAPQPGIHRDFKQRLIDPEITPRLLTSLKSHTCWPPLCLSLRSTPQTIIASVAYALPTYLSGWTVGLQELHLTGSGTILRSRLASGVDQGFQSSSSSSGSSSPSLSQTLRPSAPESNDSPHRSRSRQGRQTHPTSLSYSHPYLLAGNRDNTLSLYLVTSNNEDLKISKSTTLWGHTSSVSGAQVGGRGKAVSVSARGEELRVWELESGLGRKVVQERSVLVRRERRADTDVEEVDGADVGCLVGNLEKAMSHDAPRRGWVGFNDEVVIVLEDVGDGEQALVVYDFT